jgi:hypothetical protein
MENAMNHCWLRKGLLIFVLSGVAFVAACGSSNPEGKYQDSEGTVTLELKGGKANMTAGPIQLAGTYTVDGDKLIIRPAEGDTSQSVTLSINKDGSLDAPNGAMPRLQKAK